MTTLLVTLSLLSLAALGLFALLWPAVRDSTLRYAWGWTGLTLAAVLGTEWLVAGAQSAPDADWLIPTRYMAAVFLFCPMMSVLGSKRPHDQAWQWIVLSLWGILVLPAMEWFAVRRGATMEIHGVRGWFLVLLILMTGLHAIGTRGSLIGLLVAVAQFLMLQEHLPNVVSKLAVAGIGRQPTSLTQLLAIGLLETALVVAFRLFKRPPSGQGLNRVWCDFRDQFGTLWALRIMERVNAAASAGGWRTRLEWNGFSTAAAEDREGPIAATTPNHPTVERKEPVAESYAESNAASVVSAEALACQQALWNLLRRFVTVEWSEARGWTPPAAKAD